MRKKFGAGGFEFEPGKPPKFAHALKAPLQKTMPDNPDIVLTKIVISKSLGN